MDLPWLEHVKKSLRIKARQRLSGGGDKAIVEHIREVENATHRSPTLAARPARSTSGANALRPRILR
jgi:hypothetical protein